MPFVVYDDKLDAGLLPGAAKSGYLPFLVNKDDDNFELIYRENIFSDNAVVLWAQPPLDEGIEVTAKQNINVRSGPGTSYTVVGSLSKGDKDIAFGRNSVGDWLQVSSGWVFKDGINTTGDIGTLPITGE
jgi:hypothetical protein